jgi:predicted amidohydrolase
MQDLKVALVQADQVWENKEANFKNYSSLLKYVQNVDLIVLPEMFHTGFSMNTVLLAEKMENSSGLKWLKDLAQEKESAVYTSLIIEENSNYYNRGIFILPSGEYHFYDKRKTFGLAGEDKAFKAGTTETIVNYKNWNFQLQVCYDLRFPEIVRNKLDSNQNAVYDVILYVANWPQRRIVHWQSLLKARAIENQCYVIGVNRVGIDKNELVYSGGSACIDAMGEEFFKDSGTEHVKIVTLLKENLNATRELLPFLKDQ